MWKRALIVLATGAIVPIGLAGPAAADIPSGTELPGAGPFCSFPILIQDVRNNRRERTSTLPDGSTVVRTTGKLIQRITNETTNKSIVIDVSGPTTDTTSPDGTAETFSGEGGNLLIFGPGGQRNTGEPPVVVTHGKVRVTITINSTTGVGTARTFELHGKQDDVCKRLA